MPNLASAQLRRSQCILDSLREVTSSSTTRNNTEILRRSMYYVSHRVIDMTIHRVCDTHDTNPPTTAYLKNCCAKMGEHAHKKGEQYTSASCDFKRELCARPILSHDVVTSTFYSQGTRLSRNVTPLFVLMASPASNVSFRMRSMKLVRS